MNLASTGFRRQHPSWLANEYICLNNDIELTSSRVWYCFISNVHKINKYFTVKHVISWRGGGNVSNGNLLPYLTCNLIFYNLILHTQTSISIDINISMSYRKCNIFLVLVWEIACSQDSCWIINLLSLFKYFMTVIGRFTIETSWATYTVAVSLNWKK